MTHATWCDDHDAGRTPAFGRCQTDVGESLAVTRNDVGGEVWVHLPDEIRPEQVADVIADLRAVEQLLAAGG